MKLTKQKKILEATKTIAKMDNNDIEY